MNRLAFSVSASLLTAFICAAGCGSSYSADPPPFTPGGDASLADSSSTSTTDSDAEVPEQPADAAIEVDDSGNPKECIGVGTPGALNAAGGVAVTGTYTDWAFSSANLTELAWTLNVDQDIPNDGYFWSHQFGFSVAGAPAAYAGMQEHGYFNPPSGGVERPRVVLFSVGEGALGAELGDVKAPDGYVKSGFDNSTGWSTMIKYPWVSCRTYAFRVSKGETSGANQWWNAYVKDTYTGIETFISRILVPGAWGGIGSGSTVFSERFSGAAINKCSDFEYSSAVFGKPTAKGGTLLSFNNHFYNPTYCPNSRFTNLPVGTRHEIGVK